MVSKLARRDSRSARRAGAPEMQGNDIAFDGQQWLRDGAGERQDIDTGQIVGLPLASPIQSSSSW